MRNITLIAAALACAAGCRSREPVFTSEQLDKGLVIVLPGIEGPSPFNRAIRRGLIAAGVDCAVPIHAWGRQIPVAGVLINQMDVTGNRNAAADLARVVIQYQDSHPGKPVFLVGHSGGGGIAVFTAESLPPGRKVDGLILLSASVSRGYDLTRALSHCKKGIVNFYSQADVGLLVIGTTLAGNVDGVRGPAAGAYGFENPERFPTLFQNDLTNASIGSDPHTAATSQAFVYTHVAPWITAPTWPPQ